MSGIARLGGTLNATFLDLDYNPPAGTTVGEEAGNDVVSTVTVNSGGRSVTDPVTNLPDSRAATVSREQGSSGIAQRLNLVVNSSQQQTLSTEQVQALLGQAMQRIQQGGAP